MLFVLLALLALGNIEGLLRLLWLLSRMQKLFSLLPNLIWQMELFCLMKLDFPEYLVLGFGDASVHHDGLFVIIWVLGFYRFV